MTAPRFGAWRYMHPDFDIPEPLAGLAISSGGGIAMVEGNDSVRQAVLLLLTTIPGERVMRPDYGCPLNRLIFSPNDDTTAGLAMHYVRSAVERWEPRVSILTVDAQRNADAPERLDVYLSYRVRDTQRIEGLTMPILLAEGPA